VKWGESYATLTVVTLGLTLLLIGTVVLAVAVEPVRPTALGFAGLFLIARLIVGIFRLREAHRLILELKAANGGALPIPHPRRARILIASFAASFAVVGLGALVWAVFADPVDRIALVVCGGTVLLFGALFAFRGWRIFRARAAADRAAAGGSAPPPA
jgi:hypothetical protein